MNQFQSSTLLKLGTGGSKFQLYVLAGPTLSIFTGGNKETFEVATYQNGLTEEYWSANPLETTTDNLTKNIFSLTAGAGVNILLPHYTVFVEGRQGFSKKNQINTETESIKFKSSVIQMGVLFKM